jgi:phospholipase C
LPDRIGFWPKYKAATSMGHYHRDDIPFQFALAEAFTVALIGLDSR